MLIANAMQHLLNLTNSLKAEYQIVLGSAPIALIKLLNNSVGGPSKICI